MSNDQLDMAKIKPENVVDDGHASGLTFSIQRFVQIAIRSYAYANNVISFVDILGPESSHKGSRI